MEQPEVCPSITRRERRFRHSKMFIQQKRDDEAVQLKKELAEFRAQMADAFYNMSEPA